MIQIVSSDSRIFQNRHEAGILLAEALIFEKKADKNFLIMGIPRGGVVVAAAVADTLQFSLDIVLTNKLSAPNQPELAIGAIDENGHFFIDKTICSLLKVDKNYIIKEKNDKFYKLEQKKARYRAVKAKVPCTGKSVIVVDDGIATGASLQAALSLVKQEHPEKLWAAIPVGPENAIRQLESFADKIICWQVPYSFTAVGEYYHDFSQTTDQEVLEILRKNQ